MEFLSGQIKMVLKIKTMDFNYKVSIQVVFTREEADVLYRHVAAHPDLRHEAKQGGKVFSFVNYYKDQEVHIDLDIRTIDMFSKALELKAPNVDQDQRLALVVKLYDYVNEINSEYNRIIDSKPQ